ncbi:hypothetical protein AURDEDRAFT_163641 [Auricularia subglabra TFB-10046 SS5]|nr:hypothetical protein AURDEDRAFT_163641 [Auricularia subglabra TFB-10046 SS5]
MLQVTSDYPATAHPAHHPPLPSIPGSHVSEAEVLSSDLLPTARSVGLAPSDVVTPAHSLHYPPTSTLRAYQTSHLPERASLANPRSAHPPPLRTRRRWPCLVPSCTKTYARSYDRDRHVASAHRGDLSTLGDAFPRRVQALVSRRNACPECGKAFNRADILARHVDEVHAAPGTAPPGYVWQWALVPTHTTVPVPSQQKFDTYISPSSGSVERPAAGTSFTRPYDLIRHLVVTHHAHISAASEAEIMAAGVPHDLVYRVGELLERTNRCEQCGKAFSRRDALVRHKIEQRHQPAAEPPTSPALSELNANAGVSGHATTPEDLVPGLGVGPRLLHNDFADSCALHNSAGAFSPSPAAPTLPSLDDWEALVCAWVAMQEGTKFSQ